MPRTPDSPARRPGQAAADDRTILAATLCAAAMIASQVAGKAARDAFFLANFHVSALPTVLIVSSLLSLVVVLLAAPALSALSPARIAPAAFAVSAVFQIAEWALAHRAPRAAAVALYLHVGVFGAVLVSWFWSMVSERLDPRTAKKRIGGIAAGGAFGGVLGGLMSGQVGARLSVVSVLPMLAALQLFCALALTRLRREGGEAPRGADANPAEGRQPSVTTTGLATLRFNHYLRHLAAIVTLGTIAAALLDYVMKAEASAAYRSSGDLVRFFAVFHTVVSLLTFLLQSLGNRTSLERLGLANTVASLPASVAAGGVAALVFPQLWTAWLVRGAESVLRSSLFRSGYEILFTPLSAGEKRATKTFVDVGCERAGDAAGGGIVKLVLWIAPFSTRPVLVAIAVLLSAASLWIARRLSAGYVRALERSLLDHKVALDVAEVEDKTTMMTLASVTQAIRSHPEPQPAPDALLTQAGVFARPVIAEPPGAGAGPAVSAEGPLRAAFPAPDDPVLEQIGALRSRDPSRVRKTLRAIERVDPLVAPHVVALLGRDDVAKEALDALRTDARAVCGALLDALLDPSRDDAVRRRVPRALAACPTPRAADGLVAGLADKRFEVRYQCGQALAKIRRAAAVAPVARDAVLAAIEREVAVEKSVWKGQRLLERLAEEDESPFVDSFLRDRASRSLEHVFTLLSLVFPEEPLRVAYRGLHTDEPNLRGTALEYLESILPPKIRDGLLSFLEEKRPPRRPAPAQTRDEILDKLMQSNQSIKINLAELRKRMAEGDAGPR